MTSHHDGRCEVHTAVSLKTVLWDVTPTLSSVFMMENFFCEDGESRSLRNVSHEHDYTVSQPTGQQSLVLICRKVAVERLVSYLRLWMSVFSSIAVHVGFVLDEVTLGQVYFRVHFGFPLTN
jgi:hypothetical protein